MKFYVVNTKTSKVKYGPFDTELEAKAEMFAYNLSRNLFKVILK
jgi:hypothetical protein